ncbi:hypothetical protein E3N88_00341 [Mikania micrantha]|uniref:Retrotransposon Copia-like N-terminal domain-containing protein n=1 Tax=Mikania micrantha TaxID=192012 RepID=A0A5N6PXR8_9ASTR|nr:hypothetical protein E3N88_00341 [Mikania micrantha]
MSHENNSSFALKSILEKDKLNNTNFLKWHRNLKIVLKFAKKHYVLEGPVPNKPEGNAAAARKAWEKHNEDAIEVACLMQATMSSDVKKNMEDMSAFDMIQQLTGMFQKQASQERYDTMKQLIACKMHEGSSVSAHVLTMKGYIEQLSKLGYPLSNEMEADFILNSLPKSYDQFVMNFNMNVWEKTVPELHGMLKTAEMNVPSKVKKVLTVRSTGVRKPNPKKQGYNNKGKNKAIVAAKHDTNKAKPINGNDRPWTRGYVLACFQKEFEGEVSTEVLGKPLITELYIYSCFGVFNVLNCDRNLLEQGLLKYVAVECDAALAVELSI